MPQDTIAILPPTTASVDLQKPAGSVTPENSTEAGETSFSLLLQASQESVNRGTGQVLSVPRMNPEEVAGQQGLPQDGKVLPQVVTTELNGTLIQAAGIVPEIAQKLSRVLAEEDGGDSNQETPLTGNVVPFSLPVDLPPPAQDASQASNTPADRVTNIVNEDGLARRSVGQLPLLADPVIPNGHSHQDETASALLSLASGDKGFAQTAVSAADNLAQISTLAQQAQAPSSPSQGADKAVISLPVETPLHAKAWGDEIGNHVQWLLSQKMQVAELRLNPPNLGSVDVRVQLMQDDQFSVHFHTPHALVKDSLEASLPRLRDLMSDNGLNLVNVDVAQHSYSEHQQGEEQAVDQGLNGRESSDSRQSMLVTESEDLVSGRGLLDLYA